MVSGIFFNESPIKNGFDHMLALEALFQSVLHGVAFDEVISLPDAFLNGFNVHEKESSLDG